MRIGRRRRGAVGGGVAAVGVVLVATGTLAAAASPAAPSASRVNAATKALHTLHAEPAPQLDAADAVALAAAPAGVDPVSFERQAMAQATNAATAPSARRWRQVGPTGQLLNDPNYATDEGRLPTTGIVLAIATDPRSTVGDIAYIGTGGGVYKTTNGGKSWTAAAGVPGMPVSAITVDRAHPNNVYAITGQGFQGGGEFAGLGAYYSHDSGATWHASSSSVHGAGQQVAVGPDGTVFAATTGGLFRSTDHGVTWSNVLLPTDPKTGKPATGTPVGSWTSDVVVKPGAGSTYTVYAAVGYVAGNVTITNPDGSTTQAAPGNGLYKSTADGKVGSFKRVDVSSSVTGWEQPYGHISSDPIGRTRLTFSPDGKYLFALVADAGHRSSGVFGPADPADPLGIPHPTSLNGIYRSADGGATWDEIATSESLTAAPGSTQAVLSAASALGYDTGIQAWYNGWIAFDPSGNHLLIGEEEVYQSLADATTSVPVSGALLKPLPFQSIDAYVSACGIESTGVTPPGACPSPLPFIGGQVTHPDQHGVAVVDQGSGATRLWIGNDGGVFRQDHAASASFANGAWTSAAHLNQLLPYRAVEGSNGEVIAGLQDNGTNLYPPGSNNSYEVCGGDGTWVGVSRTDPNTFYCNENGDIVVTTDGGKTTTDITPCPASGTCGNPTFEPGATAMDPFDSNHIALATSVVYETTKGAATSSGDGVTPDTGDWVQVFDLGTVGGTSRLAEALDLQGPFMYVSGCAVCASSVKLPVKSLDRALATNVKTGCTAKVGTSNCWHFAKLIGMSQRQIYGLSADPRNVRRVYIATITPSVIRVDFAGATAGRVFMSTDAGDHVTDMTGNLPQGNVWDIKVIGTHVYAATDYGVFVAKVGSKQWQRLGTGLPTTRVFGINISANRKDLVAATYGRGVWIYPLAASGVSTSLPSKPGGAVGALRSGRSLATTGAPAGVAVAGVVLIGIGLVMRRKVLGREVLA
ncbi:MAG TPA: hypothetical protein VFH54_08910 [Mycobacteriales bacterium]|nr:hypothetical protein [Mycobacteriales bacterium]